MCGAKEGGWVLANNRDFVKRLKELCFSTLIFTLAILFLLILLEAGLRVFNTDIKRVMRIREELKADRGKFRKPPQIGPKREGEFRILALGDSFTWGDGITDPARIWPELLEAKLKADLKREKIRVVNLGMCGFTTVNEFELFVRMGQNLNPDLVIVQYLINDVLPSGPNFMRVGERWLSPHKRVNLVRNVEAHAFLDRRSYLYYFVNSRFLALQQKIWPPQDWHEFYNDDFPGWAAFKKALIGIGGLSSERDIKTILVIFPNFPDGKWTIDNFPYESIYDKVANVAEIAGLNVIDLLSHFTKRGRDFKDWRIPLDGHPNEEAHELAADVIKDFIVGNQFID